jgi:hypothetical protein
MCDSGEGDFCLSSGDVGLASEYPNPSSCDIGGVCAFLPGREKFETA